MSLNAKSAFWVERIISFQHLVNELTILIALTFMYWFSEHVSDFNQRKELGLALIYLIQANLVFNFCILSIETV